MWFLSIDNILFVTGFMKVKHRVNASLWETGDTLLVSLVNRGGIVGFVCKDVDIPWVSLHWVVVVVQLDVYMTFDVSEQWDKMYFFASNIHLLSTGGTIVR